MFAPQARCFAMRLFRSLLSITSNDLLSAPAVLSVSSRFSALLGVLGGLVWVIGEGLNPEPDLPLDFIFSDLLLNGT